jgi:sugar phosphate isomerase/epimerase
MDRRHFLWTSSATMGGLVASRAVPAFGQSQGLRHLDTIGLQLFTVRQDFTRDANATLAAVADIGYTEVELFSLYAPEAWTTRDLRTALDRAGLAARSAHVVSALLYRGWERHLEVASALGCQYIVCATPASGERRTLRDWHEMAQLFNRVGEMARQAKLQFGYHNHDFEFARLEGQVPYDVPLTETDPALVQFELDLYWITKGGGNPLDYMSQWPGRFFAFHVKDMDATAQRGMADVGAGIIDFAKIFGHAEHAGIKHYFVEHDTPAPPAIESVRRSYAYLQKLRF